MFQSRHGLCKSGCFVIIKVMFSEQTFYIDVTDEQNTLGVVRWYKC